MTFKSKCLLCGRTSYGWGYRCICGLPVHFDMSYPVVNKKPVEVNEPNHDLEYHNKKCEGR